MIKTKKITSFRVSWTADHEQFYPGHSTIFSDYTHSGNGVGETIREAFEDAIRQLYEDDALSHGIFNAHDVEHGKECEGCRIEKELLADLTSQVKDPAMLDWDIVRAECPSNSDHHRVGDDGEPIHESDEVDCAVCAGEWHFYVNVDVQVGENNG